MDIGTHDTGKSQGPRARSPVDGSGGRSGYWIPGRWRAATLERGGRPGGRKQRRSKSALCFGIYLQWHRNSSNADVLTVCKMAHISRVVWTHRWCRMRLRCNAGGWPIHE
ncbi:hypothetical protein CSHISOI_01784 [Colletotrichum shisoi]|uniref:Uncharacterized protein n=1 Tax=Colletotrichum shisoi TaxID=2078593 RepID=A0A5Q4C2U5_9PEZI|nr:hypothetical protein CSHISOI_01784 [Colletotrichum shisoi]